MNRCADCLDEFLDGDARFVVIDEPTTPVYGYPCVTDPNDFHPDAECCSPEELEAHRVACETFGTPAYEPNKGCYTEYHEDGSLMKHVLRTSWGIGTNVFHGRGEVVVCGDCANWYGESVVRDDEHAG